MLQDTHDILLTNYEDQEPVLRFDGVGGIVMSNVGSDRRTLLFINCNSLSFPCEGDQDRDLRTGDNWTER